MKIYLLDEKKKITSSTELTVPRTRIGRDTENEISLTAAGISRFHAELTCDSGKWFINDLGSTNGTRVNNILIPNLYLLNEGDLIEIGDQRLRFGEPAPLTHTEVRNVSSLDAAAADTASLPSPDLFDPEKTTLNQPPFNGAETIKGQAPIFDEITAPPPFAPPSIIINLPQTGENDLRAATGGFVLEPVASGTDPSLSASVPFVMA